MFDAEVQPPADSWRIRNEHWNSETQNEIKRRARRERRNEPLILCGHGVSMRVDAGTLLIRDGCTHYPHEPDSYRYFKGDLATAPRIILLDGSGSISFEVLDWLSEQGVPLVRINWKGEVLSILGGNGYAADRNKVTWQEATRADPEKRLAFSADLVRRKIAASIETLEAVIPASTARDAAITKARDAVAQLAASLPGDLTALRLIEATCASAYFAAWRFIKLNWKATTRRPVPDDWRRFTSRTSLANNGKLLNINATHPINAMLNYAYGALEAKLRIEAVAAGFDPTIGVMHNGRREKSAYVFDLMEPERPRVDRALLTFALAETFSGADFVIRSDGVCRLTPQLAKRVCQIVAANR